VSSPLPSRYRVTTPYGVPGPWQAGYHTGDDYSTFGIIGVPVFASHGGFVVDVSGGWGPAYGQAVIVEGRRHRIRVGYCHLHSVECSPGDWVQPGQLVGYSGNTGHSTGPHLHYEERRRPFHYGDDRKPRFNQ